MLDLALGCPTAVLVVVAVSSAGQVRHALRAGVRFMCHMWPVPMAL
jgi:hypothetical protein